MTQAWARTFNACFRTASLNFLVDRYRELMLLPDCTASQTRTLDRVIDSLSKRSRGECIQFAPYFSELQRAAEEGGDIEAALKYRRLRRDYERAFLS